MRIGIDAENIPHVRQGLHNVPNSIRKPVLKLLAQKVISNSKARVAQQVDVEGSPFPLHQRRRKRKMLARLVKHLAIVKSSEFEVIVGFKNPVHGEIAAKQQEGFTETVTRQSMSVRQADPNAKATRRQARALQELQFKVRMGEGKPRTTPTIKWIVENMKMGQAGAIIRELRGSSAEQWTTTLPKRSFLGVSPAEMDELMNLAIQEARNAMDAVR